MRGVPEGVTEGAGVTVTFDDGDEQQCAITEVFDLAEYTDQLLLTQAMRAQLHKWNHQEATIVCAYPKMVTPFHNEFHLVFTGHEDPSFAGAALNDSLGNSRPRDIAIEDLAFSDDVEVTLANARVAVKVQVDIAADEPAMEAIPKLEDRITDSQLDVIRLDTNANQRRDEDGSVIVPCKVFFEYPRPPWKSVEGLVQDAAGRIPADAVRTVTGGSLV